MTRKERYLIRVGRWIRGEKCKWRGSEIGENLSEEVRGKDY